MPWARGAALLAAVALGGCEGAQSALDARSDEALATFTLTQVMFAGAAVVFALVMVLAGLAASGRARWLGDVRTVAIGGIAFPVLTLGALLTYGLAVAGSIGERTRPAALRVEVSGEQFWWRVSYFDGERRVATSANEIRLPAGAPVDLELVAPDVIHSFWVPALAGKRDLIPGRRNRLRITAREPGTYRGQCAEFCGVQHAQMAFHVVVLTQPEFARWFEAQAMPAAEPASPELERGRALFMSSGCYACHTVRGTPAAGVAGPDLTHVGSRLAIGAGMYPNNVGTLAGWIAGNQHLKPGNHMPEFRSFDGAELRAIAAWLASLE